MLYNAVLKFFKPFGGINNVKNTKPVSYVGKQLGQGSGCGSVGRAVPSDTRGPRFESSHRQILY